MDRLRALAMFKAVVDHGGFARAAAAMDLAPSVATRCVQELEDQLGVRLLLRTTRSVALTTVGEKVFAQARELLAAYSALEAIGSLAAAEPLGRLRLAVPAALARCCLAEPLAAFRRTCPKVWLDVRLRDGPADAAGDEADLVVCLGSDLRPMTIARTLMAGEVGLFAAPAFLRAHGEPQHPAELPGFDGLAGRSSRDGTWTLFDRDRMRFDAKTRVVMHAGQDDLLLDAAVHGAGIVLLPTFLAAQAVTGGRLQRVLGGWNAGEVTVHLAYASRRHQPLSVRQLIEHLVAWFRVGTAAGPVAPTPELALWAGSQAA